MIYLWTFVDVMWPCLYGLFMFGLAGYAGEGYAGMKAVWLNAVGIDTVMITLFAMMSPRNASPMP